MKTNPRMNAEQIERRIDRLTTMISRYKHRWNDNPSPRLMGWVDELNEIIDLWPNTYREHCVKNNLDPSSTAHDILA